MGSLGSLASIGSLFLGGGSSSRSAAPAPVSTPAPVSVPQPVSAPASAPATVSGDTGSNTGSSGDSPDPVQTAAAARSDDLLRRSRGRTGTIQTSFRGLLSAANSTAQRKTLLGE